MANFNFQGKIIRQFWGKIIRQSTKNMMNPCSQFVTGGGQFTNNLATFFHYKTRTG